MFSIFTHWICAGVQIAVHLGAERMTNQFKSFIRSHYHGLGRHQMDLAKFLAVEDSTISRWLSGASRMTDETLGRLASWLELNAEDREWMFLAHDLLHAGPRVAKYVETLEGDRFGNEVCDQRIRKLRVLLEDLDIQRADTAHLRPVIFRQKPRIKLADDEETNGGTPP